MARSSQPEQAFIPGPLRSARDHGADGLAALAAHRPPPPAGPSRASTAARRRQFSGRPGEFIVDQCLGFAQQDNQRIPGGIGSGVARQLVDVAVEVEWGTSSGLARD